MPGRSHTFFPPQPGSDPPPAGAIALQGYLRCNDRQPWRTTSTREHQGGSMANRALSISAKDVAKAVDSAVKAVADKHKVKFAPEFRIGPGTIIGRQLLQAEVNLQQAEQIATELTQRAAAAS